MLWIFDLICFVFFGIFGCFVEVFFFNISSIVLFYDLELFFFLLILDDVRKLLVVGEVGLVY